MTTFAWDGISIAADTQVTSDEAIDGYAKKLWHISDHKGGGAITGAGKLSELEAFKNWYLDNKPDSFESLRLGDHFEAVVFSKGNLVSYDHRMNTRTLPGRYAGGSGWKWAQAALDHGKSAKEAVEYAATKCLYTGGEIDVIDCLFEATGEVESVVPGTDILGTEVDPPASFPVNRYLDIVFDGPPGPQAGRFVEVENRSKESVAIGYWMEREDGYSALRIPDYRQSHADLVVMANTLAEAEAYLKNHLANTTAASALFSIELVSEEMRRWMTAPGEF